MTKPKSTGFLPKSNSFRQLISLCDPHSNLYTRIALLSFYQVSYSKFTEGVILLFEYLQHIAQALFLYNSSGIVNSNLFGNKIYQFVIYLTKIYNPGYFLPYTSNSLSLAVLFSLAMVVMFKCLLFVYILYIAKRNKTGHPLLLRIWRFIFKTQARLLYSFVTTFWLKAAYAASKDHFEPFGKGKGGIIPLSAAVITLECIISLFVLIFDCNILPTKSFLSSKNRKIEVMNVLQKFILQMLRIGLRFSTQTNTWFFVTVNIIFGSIRPIYFFHTLPPYKWSARLLHGNLIMITSALHFTCFIEVIIREFDEVKSPSFLLMVWTILSVLAVWVTCSYLKSTLVTIMNDCKNNTIRFQLDKLLAIKHIRRMKRLPSPYNDKYEWNYLLGQTLEVNINKILDLNSEFVQENGVNTETSKSANKMFMSYLERLLLTNPKDDYIKLFIAYYYAKKLKLYSTAMKFLSELQHSSSLRVMLNAFLLIYSIQNNIRLEYKSGNGFIDLVTFLQSKTRVAQMKESMINQTNLQIKLCQEMLGDKPDLGGILECSKEFYEHKKAIEKQMNTILATVPDCYVEPLITYAYYCLLTVHSPTNHQKYYELYLHRSRVYQKHYESKNLIPENFYQENCALLTLSAQKADASKIIFCSKSMEKVYGGEAHQYIGIYLASLGLPTLRPLYVDLFRNMADKEEHGLLARPLRGYGCHKDGYVLEVEFYMNFHPFLTQGYYLTTLIRPIISTNEQILVRENGDLEGVTKTVGNKLGLIDPKDASLVHTFNISQLSNELGRACEAFNQIALPEKYGNEAKSAKTRSFRTEKFYDQSIELTPRHNRTFQSSFTSRSGNRLSKLEKPEELYSTYTTEGKEVLIKAVGKRKDGPQDSYIFHCKISNFFFGSILLKTITLEEVKTEQDEDFPHRSLENQPKNVNHNKMNLTPNDSNNETEENNDSQSIPSEKMDRQKDLDWTNTNKLESEKPNEMLPPSSDRRDLMLNFQSDTNRATEGPLLSPLSVTKRLSGTNVPLIPLQDNLIPLPKQRTTKVLKSSETNQSKDRNDKNDRKTKGRPFQEESVMSSLRGSRRHKVSKAVEKALELKDFPFFFKVLCALCFVLLVSSAVIQLVHKIILDEIRDDIKLNKDITNIAEFRNFLLISSHINVRYQWEYGQRNKNNPVLPLLSNNLTMRLGELKNTNQYLLLHTNSLDKDIKNFIFDKDVKIYNHPLLSTQMYIDFLTSFQAVERVVEGGLRAVSVLRRNVAGASDEVAFLFYNCLNGLLVKNELISQTLLGSSNQEKNRVSSLITVYMAIALAVLGIVSLIISIIIWKQHNSEKLNMFAFVKLKAQGVNEALNNLIYFKNTIENETSFDEGALEVFISKKAAVRLVTSSRERIKESSKSPNCRRLYIKYFLYIGQFLLLISILGAWVVGSSLFAHHSIHFFNLKQSQLFYTSRVRTITNLAMALATDLPFTNGTALIRNEPILDQMTKTINDITDISNSIPEVLRESDNTYDPMVQKILFDDGCVFITSLYCQRLSSKALKASMMFLLPRLRVALQDKKDSYLKSNKSAGTLSILGFQNLDVLSESYTTIVDECNLIIKTFDKLFEENLVDVKNKRNAFLLGSLFSLVILGLLVWNYLLKRLRDVNNDFKKVLQTLPSNLVLSSFILKSFLLKTSKGALDFVKNDI